MKYPKEIIKGKIILNFRFKYRNSELGNISARKQSNVPVESISGSIINARIVVYTGTGISNSKIDEI